MLFLDSCPLPRPGIHPTSACGPNDSKMMGNRRTVVIGRLKRNHKNIYWKVKCLKMIKKQLSNAAQLGLSDNF
jgi:hypothetical protein